MFADKRIAVPSGLYRSPIGAVSQSHRGCIAVLSGLYRSPIGVSIAVPSGLYRSHIGVFIAVPSQFQRRSHRGLYRGLYRGFDVGQTRPLLDMPYQHRPGESGASIGRSDATIQAN